MVDLSQGVKVVRLPAYADTKSAQQLWSALQETDTDGQIVIDGGCVERMTSSAVQIVVAAAKSFGADRDGRGGRLSVQQASDAMSNAFRSLGLAGLLGSWSAS